jgi:hypothetical protein
MNVNEYEQKVKNQIHEVIHKLIFNDIKEHYETGKPTLIFSNKLILEILDKKDKNLALLNLQHNNIYIRYASQIVLNPKITFEEVL